MKYLLWLLRIIVGVLFIFSGLIKANDPYGLSYKMNEFFEVWGMHGLMPYSLAFSVAMIGFEIIAGVAVLLGVAFRIFSFLLLLLTGFFTFLTAYVYLTDKIKECGCFGDCIKISNAETFWKDVILLAFVLILFAFRKRVPQMFNNRITGVLMTITVILAFGIQWRTLNYLPYFDCLAYKKGTHIWTKMQAPPGSKPDVYKTIMIYEKDGKQQEFDENNFPWEDSTWKFVDSKSILIQKGNADPEIKDFVLSDYEGNEQTEAILKQPGYTFFLFIRDVNKASTENIDRIHNLIRQSVQLNVPFYVLTSSGRNDANRFSEQYKLQGAQWLVMDVTVSKTAMRTNPGLMLLQDGTIRGKWSFKTYPKGITLTGNTLSYQ
ncbi:BT_3928 family protein [Rurimicrobium arvi]|uniref:DoxX family protein n=1 Tax=Rurimicrobium arvi TaxID=2049916 RepID=A0ABP8N3S1_9BACT